MFIIVHAVVFLVLFRLGKVRCQSCPQNCIQCPDGINCTECKDGFYNDYRYDKVNNCTRPCPVDYCEACSSYYNCTKCKAGYCNSGGSRTCQYQCSNNCDTCSSCDFCTKCKSWYYGNFHGAKCDECIVGKHGIYCNKNCLKGCLDDTCERYTGTCTNGCKQGYNMPKCETCMAGTYGDNCERCPQNCLKCSSVEQCNMCRERFWGTICENNCPNACTICVSESKCYECGGGFYGTNCSSKCPKNCADSTCLQEDGHCPTCKSGFWGMHCNNACGRGCSEKKCEKLKGRCLRMCMYGFTGSSCESCAEGFYGQECKQCLRMCAECTSQSHCTRCFEGYYGQTCSSECSENCDGKKCVKENGSCLSCKEGFHGEQCEIPCPDNCVTKSCKRDGKCHGCSEGYYGDKCEETCPHNCKGNCILNTGNCRSCIDGYFGNRCNEQCPTNCLNCSSKTDCLACKVGFTGNVCENECSKCKRGTSCRQTDGRCNEACADGFYDDGCDKQCSSPCRTCSRTSSFKCTSCAHGKYGEHGTYYNNYRYSYLTCDLNCSEVCLNKTCDQYNGQCTYGCRIGYWGTKCERKCSESCKTKNCSKGDGSCLEGCDKGFYGKRCTRSCTYYDTHCLECDQSSKCVECKKGHYLSYSSYFNQCKSCPSLCEHKDCNTTNGLCLHGCAKGHWGKTCEKPCASCFACNQSNGECLNCINGSFGVNCSQNCNSNCATSCEMKTGECTTGCATENRYGSYCADECDSKCLNLACNWKTGLCSSGCIPGFFGSTCDIPCSENCANNSCNWLSGDCTVGCSDGFKGQQCKQVAVEIVPSSVLAGVGAGILFLIIVVVVVAVLTFRRRKRKTTNNEVDIAERDPNANSSHVEEAGGEWGNIHDIEDSDPAVIYAKPHKQSTNQLRNSTTEHKASVSLELQGGSQGREKDDVSNAKHADIGNEDTFASAYDEEEEEILSDGDEPSKLCVIQDDGDTYYNTAAVLRRRIQLDKLKEFVSKADFLEEFKQLPFGLIKPHEVSQKPANRAKNRYRGIFPYDARRVVIKNGPSDYINASYIDGYIKRRAYIASQGPTVKQMGEDFAIFWEMIWQENVNRIVMLTNLRELEVQKCDQYWPDKGSRCSYGNILVTCLKENIRTHYTIRSFTMENVQNKTEVRTLYHMHFTSWPDKGIPKSVSFLTEFHTQTTDESFVTTSDVPVLVHCSAGIGRTGTYIALDMLTNEGRAEGHVDIFACVRNLREERVNMVQTVEQYMYLHECLVEQLTGKSKETNKNKEKKN